MITARSSVVHIPPGYYPRLTTVIEKLMRPCGKTGGKPGNKPRRDPSMPRPPLLMTPEAIRHREYNRAWKAAHRQRKQSVTSRGFSLERVLFDAAIDDPDDQHEYWNRDQP